MAMIVSANVGCESPSAGKVNVVGVSNREASATLAPVKAVHGNLTGSDAVRLMSLRNRSGAIVLVLDARLVRTCEDLGRQLRQVAHAADQTAPLIALVSSKDSAFVGGWLARERIRPVAILNYSGALRVGDTAVTATAVLLLDSGFNVKTGIVHSSNVPNTRSFSFTDELEMH